MVWPRKASTTRWNDAEWCAEFRLMTHECLSWDMGLKSTEEVECIKVDISGNKMRRWRGPQRTLGRLVCALPCLKVLTLYDVRFSHQPLDASAISRFRLLPRTKIETFSLYRLHNVSVLTPSFVELVDLIAAVSNRKCPCPARDPTQPCPIWSGVRVLHLSGVTFPSVTTFARLLCAFPALETLQFMSTCTFVKHGFDLRDIPAHSGVPSGLVAVELEFDFDTRSDPRSVADLVDLFVATGISDRLRHIHVRPSPGPLLRVTTESDVSLNRLVRHCGHSLHHLDLDTHQFWQTGIGKDVSLHIGPSAGASHMMVSIKFLQSACTAPYFDLSENTCLIRLDLRVNVTRDNASYLCTSVIEVLSYPK
ncbi:hypothetical protein IEO21_10029 [Rhodonia placenta]|uniref:Uncharacterized protein n=1 Tax=Rhodonia placenta TaxID=104341 RepID=A0A8H7NT93_9APHY|nr:hypothetical protein IEO21_10029 [Postia placenta]